MNTKLVAIAVVVIVIVAAVAVYVATDDDSDDSSRDTTSTHVVTDAAGRQVEVPDDLSNGIYAFGMNILKLASYFDDRKYIEEVDLSETQDLYGNNQSHYYVYDMSTMHTHAGNSIDASTVERVIDEAPSLVITNLSVYNNYKDNADLLGKGVALIVLDTSAMSNEYFEKDSSGKYSLHSCLQGDLRILGEAFNDYSRAEEVIGILDSTIAELTETYSSATTNTTRCSLAGSNMAMVNGDLNIVFPIWNPLDLANVTNAATSWKSSMPWTTELTTEQFINDYKFDVMFYDPSQPDGLLTSVTNQTILKYMYELQGTADEKPIYIVLISALWGYDMVNLIANTYFVESAICNTLTMDQVKEKLTALYVDLYGEDAGKTMYANLEKSISDRSDSVALPLFQQVKIAINSDGKYTFVAA